MKVKIGKSFFHKNENSIFEKGQTYTVKNDLAWWIVRKRLGEIIPNVNIRKIKEESNPLKEVKKPPKDKMMRNVKTK